MIKRRSNVPRAPLRWSILVAAREFCLDRQTLTRRLAEGGFDTGPDGMWSTAQVARAVAGGDIHHERLRETRARAQHVELKNLRMQNELLPAAEVFEALEKLFVVLRQEVLGRSDLSEDAKRSLLSHLAEFKQPGK
jgi:hypothetical protein